MTELDTTRTIPMLVLVACILAADALAQAVLTEPTSYAIGDLAIGMDAGDLDGDGHVDLVFANASSNDASVLAGAGDGTFGAEQRMRGIGSTVRDVGLADFDLDGDLDPVFLLRNGAALVVLLRNDGAGGFGSPELSGPSRTSFSSSVDDLDLDGDADVAVASMGFGVDFVAALFTNDGSGVFALDVRTFESTSTLYLTDLALGDVDGDGWKDVVGVNLISDRVSLLRNEGRGTFAAAVPIETGVVNPYVVELEDLDGDGDADMALGQRLSGRPDELLVTVNDGSGVFAPAGTHPLPASARSMLVPVALEAADIDRDGRLDWVTSDRVLFNAGGASFGPPVPLGAGGFAPTASARDLDADGDLDVVQAQFVGPSSASFAAVVLNLTPEPRQGGPVSEVPGGSRVPR